MRFVRWAAAVASLAVLSLSALMPVPLAAAEPPHPKATEGPLPESVKYWVLFRHMKALEARAAAAETKGEDGGRYRRVIRDGARLTESHAAELSSIAAGCIARVESKDREALKAIRAARAATPGGRLTKGKGAPAEPPAELVRLQSERDVLIDEARESLRSALGEKEFARLQSYVDERIAPAIRRRQVATAGAGR